MASNSEKTFTQCLVFRTLRASYLWPMIVSRVKIGFISCLETEQVFAKNFLTTFNDLQGKRRCVEEGDAYIDELHEGGQ